MSAALPTSHAVVQFLSSSKLLGCSIATMIINAAKSVGYYYSTLDRIMMHACRREKLTVYGSQD